MLSPSPTPYGGFYFRHVTSDVRVVTLVYPSVKAFSGAESIEYFCKYFGIILYPALWAVKMQMFPIGVMHGT